MDEMLQDNLLNTAPCGFLVFSDEGIILTVNDTLLKLLNYQREELVGSGIQRILSLANRIFYQTHLFPLIRLQGNADEIFLTLLSSNRTEVHVLLNAVRKKMAGKETNHCVLIPVKQRRKYEDELLLAKKAAEEALLKNELLLNTQKDLENNKLEIDRQVSKLTQMNRELMQFSKVVSHDIQEPIRKISIFADIALSQADKLSDTVMKNALEKIKISCSRMNRLVNSLEIYLSLERAAAKPEPIDLNKAIEKARLLALQAAAYKENIEIIQQPFPVITGYKNQIELLFINLIENSIKFRRAGNPVKIMISSSVFQENRFKSLAGKYSYQDVVKITFTDNSQGFDTKHSTNLFQLFQKLHTDSKGIGLGLALCKKITDNHFGEISVDSTVGEGTTFKILLPLMN